MTNAEIIALAAASMNDVNRETYTDIVVLPYYNMALKELEEIFEQNNIPVTNEESAVIVVPSGTSVIGFTTTPALPANLIEIQELWESETGQDRFLPVDKREFLIPTSNLERSFFGVWAWIDQEIHVYDLITDRDIKIDYIKSLFATITSAELADNMTVINGHGFLYYRTAGIMADLIEENAARADKLNNFAVAALDRSLGIGTKGKQSIVFRRRPFRANYRVTGPMR